MKTRRRDLEQFLGHDIEDEEKAMKYLDDALPLIGHVVMYFNGLEADLDRLLCELISDRSDAMGLLVLQGMPYSSKVELFGRLRDEHHRLDGNVPPSYVGLVDALKEAGRLRNLVVHARWEATEDDGYTYVKVRVTERGLMQEYVQLAGESIERVIETISQTRERLDKYFEDGYMV